MCVWGQPFPLCACQARPPGPEPLLCSYSEGLAPAPPPGLSPSELPGGPERCVVPRGRVSAAWPPELPFPEKSFVCPAFVRGAGALTAGGGWPVEASPTHRRQWESWAQTPTQPEGGSSAWACPSVSRSCGGPPGGRGVRSGTSGPRPGYLPNTGPPQQLQQAEGGLQVAEGHRVQAQAPGQVLKHRCGPRSGAGKDPGAWNWGSSAVRGWVCL